MGDTPQAIREDLKHLEARARYIVDKFDPLQPLVPDDAILSPDLCQETQHQAVLAVRAIEDARMRMGKVIQYSEQGGVSIFDKEKP